MARSKPDPGAGARHVTAIALLNNQCAFYSSRTLRCGLTTPFPDTLKRLTFQTPVASTASLLYGQSTFAPEETQTLASPGRT